MQIMDSKELPLWQKYTLTVEGCTYPAAYCLHQNGRGRDGPEDVAGNHGV